MCYIVALAPPTPPQGGASVIQDATEIRPRQILFDAVARFPRQHPNFPDSSKIFNFIIFLGQPRGGWVRKIPAAQTQLRGSPTQLTPPLVTFDGQPD